MGWDLLGLRWQALLLCQKSQRLSFQILLPVVRAAADEQGQGFPCSPAVDPRLQWLQTNIPILIPTCQGNRSLPPAASSFPCQDLAPSVTKAAHGNVPFFPWYFWGHFCWKRLGDAHQPGGNVQQLLHQHTCAWKTSVCPELRSLNPPLLFSSSVVCRRGLHFSVAQPTHLQKMNLTAPNPSHMPA